MDHLNISILKRTAAEMIMLMLNLFAPVHFFSLQFCNYSMKSSNVQSNDKKDCLQLTTYNTTIDICSLFMLQSLTNNFKTILYSINYKRIISIRFWEPKIISKHMSVELMLQNPSFNACIVSHPAPLRFREFSTARWATSKSCKRCESRARSATAAGQAQTSPKGATTTRDGSAGHSAGGVKTEITRIFLCKKKNGLWKPKGFWMNLFHHHKRFENQRFEKP